MNTERKWIIPTVIFIVLLTTLACSLGGTTTEGSPTKAPTGTLRQWANRADASSSFGSIDWSAAQAVGAPNTLTCGDQVTAWASSSYQGEDWLDVGFATAVTPTQINIHESFTPGSIVKVELRDSSGSFHTVYEHSPAAVAQCPRILTINLSNINYKVNAILISVDQTVLMNWDEIDAVELVGTP